MKPGMKILWLDINSSYSHSSVALPAIHAQVRDVSQWEWCVVYGTINDDPGSLAAAVASHNPDMIASTFWLFTHQMQVEVLSRVVQLLDDVKVVCGGPEFLGDNEDFLRRNRFVTAVLRGEGEFSFPDLLRKSDNPSGWSSVEGLCWISGEDGAYHDNGIAKVHDFASLHYSEESPFFNWDKPFVQLETARGCFNTCAFCVSGGDKPVRNQTIEQVKIRLENICAHGIRDVRVLDRTFNHDISRACRMLDLFAEYSPKMRFHLEIHPSLLNPALKERIAALPAGLLHLEAGIQSLGSKVLQACGRKGSVPTSLDGLEYLCSLDNVQIHADLIAGLPEYDLDMLCNDIETLVKMGVDELQVESLKVLPGTQMRKDADAKGLKYSPLPPYEILQTPLMNPSELKMAMQISRMVDLYYNCPAWQKITARLITEYKGFIKEFTDHLKSSMVLDSPLSAERRGVILHEYCRTHYPQLLTDVSVAWISAGFSLKKEPARNIVKIKHIDSIIETDTCDICIEYGEADPTYRYYLLNSGDRQVLFGYDSKVHSPYPTFMATIVSRHTA